MNFFEFNKKFPTQLDCVNHFIGIRYGNNIKCVHCSNPKILHRKDYPKVFQCNACHNSFSIFKGTIFEKSDTDLRKWMYAIHLFLNGKKGISGYQLQREIGVTYKTAWRMLKQIRMAMGNLENKEFMGLIAEIDETYAEGKPRKKNKKKDNDDTPKNKPGRGTKKEAVVGVVDRENKKVFAQVMRKNKDGKKLTGKQLLDVLIRSSSKTASSLAMNSRAIISFPRRPRIYISGLTIASNLEMATFTRTTLKISGER
jgi:transposase-like protein